MSKRFGDVVASSQTERGLLLLAFNLVNFDKLTSLKSFYFSFYVVLAVFLIRKAQLVFSPAMLTISPYSVNISSPKLSSTVNSFELILQETKRQQLALSNSIQRLKWFNGDNN